MTSIGIEIGSITITWYSICILVGVILATILINSESEYNDITPPFATNLVFWCMIFGIIGARAYYVLFNLDYYMNNPINIIKIWEGGLAIHGGIIAGLITLLIYCKKYRVNALKMLDIAAPAVLLAQAIGRWGNFFNKEAYGSMVTRTFLEDLHLPEFIINGMHINGNYYHPTFLYESVWNLIGFIIMLFLRRRKYNKVGEMSGFYLIWYSSARFFIEGLRMDSLMLGPLRVAQIVSIIGIIAGIIFIACARKGSKFDNLYNKEEKDETRF
jgi:phosphatidylglycerol:prolipoprotein diacylglycerol transferase